MTHTHTLTTITLHELKDFRENIQVGEGKGSPLKGDQRIEVGELKKNKLVKKVLQEREGGGGRLSEVNLQSSLSFLHW